MDSEEASVVWVRLWREHRAASERLFEAVRQGHVAEVVATPRATELQTLYGRTALHLAAMAGQTEVAEARLRMGELVALR